MPDAVDVGGATRSRHRVGNRPARPHVVEDVGARGLLQHELGQQRREEVAVDELALVVDEEAAVGVPVPGDADVGALGPDAVDDEGAVLGQQRVRLVVGEVAVGDPVGRDQVERQPVEQRPDHLSRHAVAAIDDDLHRLDRFGVDEGERPLLELGRDVDLLRRTTTRGVAEAGEDEVADRGDAGVAGKRQGSLPDQLHPGVGLRVVGGGDHRAAVELPRADHEVEHLGAHHPGVEDVRALGLEPLAQPSCHLRSLQAHIAADADAQVADGLAAEVGENAGERPAEEEVGVAVHLAAVEAADVIGLEDPLLDRPRSAVRVAAFRAQLKPPSRAS